MDPTDEQGLVTWPAAERNKQPILEQLLNLVPKGYGKILEIAAATGQHAVHFAPHFPGYDYYVSDRDEEHLATLLARIKSARIPNLMGPLRLDVTDEDWKVERVQVVYNANMVHIAPYEATVGLFRGVGRVLAPDGLLLTYGPYRVDGRHTSESNERFDESLRARNAEWGVRDIAELQATAITYGLRLVERHAMPANNFLLVWRPSI